METLTKGQDIWMAMNCDSEVFSSLFPHDGLPAVMSDFDGNGSRSGHAMLIAGYP
jgi:hypothetical protein